MQRPSLGHDGPQGSEGHQLVFYTNAYSGWWGKSMWAMHLSYCIPFVEMKNKYTDNFSHCFGNVFIHCLPPGSVSSCDAFLNVFQSHGLRPEAVCPCATSPEALTVAIRRYHWTSTLDTKSDLQARGWQLFFPKGHTSNYHYRWGMDHWVKDAFLELVMMVNYK